MHRRRYSYTFNPLEHPGGVRKLRIVARDQLNHKSETTFRVTVPATGALRYPRDGTRTSRKVKLQAENVAAGLTTVKFQYRRGSGSWTDIPLNGLFTEGGQPVGSQTHAISAGTSPVIVWDGPRNWNHIGTTALPSHRALHEKGPAFAGLSE